MNKTVKVAIISVMSTLLVVFIILGVFTPIIVSDIKYQARLNFGDDKKNITATINEMREPVFQTNYIITGLILSPDFQEFLDKGVVMGWWTKDYLEQFLFDESLPILFNNYRALMLAILTSDGATQLVDKLTTVQSTVQRVIANIRMQLYNLTQSQKVKSVKQMIQILKEDINTLQLKFNAIENTLNNFDYQQISKLLVNVKQLINTVETVGIDGIVGDILENVIASDFVQSIIDNLALTADNLVKFINLYFTKFIDYDYDYNWYNPLVIGDKTIDLSKYALLLNVIDLEISDSSYTFDDGGTKLDTSDDKLVISQVLFGFEIDSKPQINILSKPIEITGKNAVIIKTAIPKFNQFI